MKGSNILWLTDKFGLSEGYKMLLTFPVQKEKLSMSNIYFAVVGTDKEQLDTWIKRVNPKILVCTCDETLQLFIKGGSLFQCRGSVYEYQHEKEVLKVVVMNNQKNWHNMKIEGRSIPGRWYLLNDIQKLARHYHGRARSQPKFSFTICETVADLRHAQNYANQSVAIACDTETHPGGKITVVGICCFRKDGAVHTFVIPFFAPFRIGMCHWKSEEDEVKAWQVVKQILANESVKIFQNGAYDAAHFLRYNIPINNYLLDTMHMWRGLFIEAPKKINVISSILLDYCKFWKDEAKGDSEEESKSEHKGKFKDEKAWDRYLRYNALDCYNTLLDALVLCNLLARIDYARINYSMEFALQVGPALVCTMRGMRKSPTRLLAKMLLMEEKANIRLAELQKITDDPDFNPNSAEQLSHFLYKTLGAKPPTSALRKMKTKKKQNVLPVDEPTLKQVRLQHPLLDWFIDKLLDYKKAAKNVSSFGRLKYPSSGRLMYALNAGGTETHRFSCRKHVFDYGTQVQNVTSRIRDFIIADDGYVIFEPDFGQSDMWFVAKESGDAQLQYNLESGRDMHCAHCAFFFGMEYDEVVKRHKNKDPIISGEPEGLRYVSKRIGHGKNYEMRGFRLYTIMGRTAVVAAARALGFANAHEWDEKRVSNFCQSLLDKYDLMYPGLAPWKKQIIREAIQNGNRLSVFGGYTRQFFGNLDADDAAQREAIAYKGQGGTAGNINRVLLQYYYKRPDLARSLLLTQTHDSLFFLLPEDNFHYYAEKILTLMNEKISVKGREFRVPVDGKIGLCWGPGPLKDFPGMIKYSPSVTLQDLRKNADKIDEYYQEVLRSHMKVTDGEISKLA